MTEVMALVQTVHHVGHSGLETVERADSEVFQTMLIVLENIKQVVTAPLQDPEHLGLGCTDD